MDPYFKESKSTRESWVGQQKPRLVLDLIYHNVIIFYCAAPLCLDWLQLVRYRDTGIKGGAL